MSNSITIMGKVCNFKTLSNGDSGSTVVFDVSTKTVDPKRWNSENNNRDFFHVLCYVPSNKANLLKFLVDGSYISVTGIPYQTVAEDGKRYFNIKATSDFITFIPVNAKNNETPSKKEAPQEQSSEGATGTSSW